MKAVAEIFKLASRINIKPKDIIGMGGDIVKMGKSLFNTKVNPKLTEFISDNGKIPTKIVEEIKIHLRSLKNASETQVELFKLNLKDIVNAKELNTIQTTPGLGDLWPRQIKKVVEKVEKEFALKRFKNIAEKSKSPVTSIKQPATSVKDAAEAFKGWTPTVIKGGKDKLADGGITRIPYGSGSNGSNGTSSKNMSELHSLLSKSLSGSLSSDEQSRLEYLIDITGYLKFNEGGMAKLNAELNQLPEYYLPMAEGGIANHFRKK